jgi:replicative DNA helicase
MKKMFDLGKIIDLFTLSEFLKKEGKLDYVGGSYKIATLTEHIVSSAHIEEHCRIVLERYMEREVIRIGSDAVFNAYDETADVFDTMNTAQSDLEAVSSNFVRKDYVDIENILLNFKDKIETNVYDDLGFEIMTVFAKDSWRFDPERFLEILGIEKDIEKKFLKHE